MATKPSERIGSISSDKSARDIAKDMLHSVSPKWYRSTKYNAIILGLANFLAPGLWGAMNSLGAGGSELPELVNAANALTFCLMVLGTFFSSALVNRFGIKFALVFGTLGYAPYAAGLYTNNRFGVEWFVYLGAALCGISAGVFWMAEAAIALAYPEPDRQGRFLGFWLSFRVGGQILGGAINLGLNATNNKAGKVSYTVYLIFIALQALAPAVAMLLNKPQRVQRTDGVKVTLQIGTSTVYELKQTARLFVSRNFLLIVPLIAQAVYSEAVFFTYQTLWFTVRSRALGSLLSGIVALSSGNLLGIFLDRSSLSLKFRTRTTFAFILTLQGAWWIWFVVLTATILIPQQPTYDWSDAGFGRAFSVFLFHVIGFQLNYMYLYFVVGSLAKTPQDVVRLAGLLRGTESAVQAVSYGLNSLHSFAVIGGASVNFGLWAISILPAWLVVREIGVLLGNAKLEREKVGDGESDDKDEDKDRL